MSPTPRGTSSPAASGTVRPVALVVGGSRGLGLLIARELGRQDHRVVICARDAGELDAAAQILRAQDVEVLTEVCDVTDPEAVSGLVALVEQRTGPVEICICVAGVIQVGPWSAMQRRHFREAIDVMLWGPINVALAVVPRMQQRGRGRIGMITSVGGAISVPHLLPYSTAKFGAVGFSRGLRSELSGTGITVTTVVPGLMRTGSQIRAKFVGHHGREYAWFAPTGSLPVVSMDAERAATRIVQGVLAGRAVLVLTPLAWLAPRFDALLPNVSSALLGFMARRLPDAPATTPDSLTLEGWQSAWKLSPASRALVRALTTLSSRAARRFNERPVGGTGRRPGRLDASLHDRDAGEAGSSPPRR
jgi:NAD(P)-dependent dehydrogenase (short-subunit alcohol dehydrogenase family)